MPLRRETPTFAEPVPDRQTVTPAGERVDPLPAGVRFHDVVTHVDDRGSVCEMFDPRWRWHSEPLVFVYTFTVRPGWVKGWGMHRRHEDRYFLLSGEMEVVLYDGREDSPTRGIVAKVVLSHYRRRLMNIPSGVWHADHNIGATDCVVVNFPTIQYDHAAPDKVRLPLDTDQIPYRFEQARGGW
ncbi:MAG TPA: dTDP-4-dehydrorhamnose 3,5-epimerase [Thermoanaerobaculia bacterium]|nr:dTDP-4-dehydrorhamnose 3,5-epimerase [Thermoanaerobaculia bacterium]